MAEELPTRRDVLKTAAALGAVAMSSQLAAQTAAPTSAPATQASPLVGVQIGALPLAREDLDHLLDHMRENFGINALFVFAYGHVARWVPMEQAGFRGGNFAIPHMQYYKNTNLTYEDMRAPEFGQIDILQRITAVSKKHGFKIYALIQEADKATDIPRWQDYYTVDAHGRRQGSHPGGACENNPNYRGFTQDLMEDYARSYDIDGFMWSSENQGGLLSAMGLWHHGGNSDPGKGKCFCEFCLKKAADKGINADRARLGFGALEQFVRDCRAGKRPRDGYFVTFMRLMLNHPELLQWEGLWIDSRRQFMIDARNRVKSVNPNLPVGFHVWHNASFSPFYRAETDFADMARNADFIKYVTYNICGGERMTSFVDSLGTTIFGDLPKPQVLQMLYQMFGYREAPYESVGAAGLSNGYITGEIQRAVDDVAGSGVPIYAGLDIDIPDSAAPYSAETVKQSVIAAFKGGAQGVVFARNYGEMNQEHLPGIRAALKELGMV